MSILATSWNLLEEYFLQVLYKELFCTFLTNSSKSLAMGLSCSSLNPVFLARVAFQLLSPLVTPKAAKRHKAAILEGLSFMRVQSSKQVSSK